MIVISQPKHWGISVDADGYLYRWNRWLPQRIFEPKIAQMTRIFNKLQILRITQIKFLNAPFDKPLRQAQGAKRINWNKLAGVRKNLLQNSLFDFPRIYLNRRLAVGIVQRGYKDWWKI